MEEIGYGIHKNNKKYGLGSHSHIHTKKKFVECPKC